MSEPNEIDCRCTCKECEARTQVTYKLKVSCPNCGWGGIALIRKGDAPSWLKECPHCGRDRLYYGTDPIFDASAPAEDGDEVLIRQAYEVWYNEKNFSTAARAFAKSLGYDEESFAFSDAETFYEAFAAALRSRHGSPATAKNADAQARDGIANTLRGIGNHQFYDELRAIADRIRAAAPQPSPQGEDYLSESDIRDWEAISKQVLISAQGEDAEAGDIEQIELAIKMLLSGTMDEPDGQYHRWANTARLALARLCARLASLDAAKDGREMREALDNAESVIDQMRLDLREPLELRGTMEGAIRSAIYRADVYRDRRPEARAALGGTHE